LLANFAAVLEVEPAEVLKVPPAKSHTVSAVDDSVRVSTGTVPFGQGRTAPIGKIVCYFNRLIR
jgi:hypothetical protein